MRDASEGDLLEGAEEIAAHLYGPDRAKAKRRRIYYLAEKGLLPLFYMGDVLCGRKSTLSRYMAAQEQAGDSSG